MVNEYEFKTSLPSGKEVVDLWEGRTMEEAARRLLDCKYPQGRIIAWRYPVCTVRPVNLQYVKIHQ